MWSLKNIKKFTILGSAILGNIKKKNNSCPCEIFLPKTSIHDQGILKYVYDKIIKKNPISPCAEMLKNIFKKTVNILDIFLKSHHLSGKAFLIKYLFYIAGQNFFKLGLQNTRFLVQKSLTFFQISTIPCL